MIKGQKPYDIVLDPKLEEQLEKLKRKAYVIYGRIVKQMLKLSKNPYIGKPLRFPLVGLRRVHVGPFVLTYEINEKERKVKFLKFEHHDEAYK
jgi:mRNA-degrading endonuclease RelE of RelBE toxin-antitoxin system